VPDEHEAHIVFGPVPVDWDPKPVHPDKNFTLFWMEINEGRAASETYTDSIRVRDSQGKESSSDLTCSPLAPGETIMRSIEVRGGLPAGVSATVDIWLAYETHRFDESAPHHVVVQIPAARDPHTSVGAAPAYPGHHLQLHSHGDAVYQWQARLAAMGYHVTADGSFGPKTAEATKQLQRDKDLTADGIVGELTWAAAWH
jgi:hypothetical protein